MTNYTQHLAHATTPQSEPLFNVPQVANNAGGFVFQIDKWAQLQRFLMLGSEGGTYYASERTLTRENAANVLACIQDSPQRVVDTLLGVSLQGRAPKNDPALFVLALVLSHGTPEGRAYAGSVIPKVARTGTHLFHLMQYLRDLRGFGRGLTTALSRWYEREPLALAKQLTKYQQRDGWSHRDVVRVIHPATRVELTEEQKDIIGYATGNGAWRDLTGQAGRYLQAVDALSSETDAGNAAKLIRDYGLPHEVVPRELLRNPEIWDALLPHMGMTALIRNLATMTKVGLLAPFSEATAFVAERLADQDALRAARVHPLTVLIGMQAYRSRAEFRPVPRVVDALNAGFYAAFGTVDGTGKRRMLALDVSGSMTWEPRRWAAMGAQIPLTPRELSAALALVVARTEPETVFMAFTDRFVPLDIRPTFTLDQTMRAMAGLPYGRTDCAMPMVWARASGLEVDSFEIYTDNETWCGKLHPMEALRQYRAERVPGAKLVVQAMTATEFSIADPNDAGALDVVGFDTASPALVADFVRGAL